MKLLIKIIIQNLTYPLTSPGEPPQGTPPPQRETGASLPRAPPPNGPPPYPSQRETPRSAERGVGPLAPKPPG
jgi:hypothetical protein